MRTIESAKAQGFEVDVAGPGRPMGSRGKIPNVEIVPVMTDLEAVMVEQLEVVIRTLSGPVDAALLTALRSSCANIVNLVKTP